MPVVEPPRDPTCYLCLGSKSDLTTLTGIKAMLCRPHQAEVNMRAQSFNERHPQGFHSKTCGCYDKID